MLVLGAAESTIASGSSVPVVVPFSAQVKGTVLELDVRLREERGYLFLLQLGFTRGDESSRRRVARLAGTGARNADGGLVDTGLAIPLEMTIHRLQVPNATPVYRRQIANFALYSHSDTYYAKLVDRVPLAPGQYRIRIEALQDIPELQGTPVSLVVAYRTK